MEACDQQTLESWLPPSELEEPLEPPNALPLREEGKSLMMWFVPKQQTLRLVPEYVRASQKPRKTMKTVSLHQGLDQRHTGTASTVKLNSTRPVPIN